jgi:hypothetical protein
MVPQLPEIFHIGWVVRDLAVTSAHLEETLGAGPFRSRSSESHFEHALVHGRTTSFSLKIAFGVMGKSIIELLEPLDDRSPHAEFLAQQGEGLHHIAFLVTDFEERVNKAREASGLELLVDGSGPENRIRWAYLQGPSTHGAVIELLERTPASEVAFADVLGMLSSAS